MNSLQVQTRNSQYSIYIGTEVLRKLTPFVESATQVVVITDETVHDLHFETLKAFLPQDSLVYVIKPGESSKSFTVYHEIQTFLIQHQVDRKALILAFGGGVVGDLAGFVASTYMRGIDFIQIPTTLLAHDSAIGGKVAINHELGKNLIGAFYPPKAVIYELSFLRTLSDKEWRSGLAEMVKHGFISDATLLQTLMSYQNMEALTSENFASTLMNSLLVKKIIVEADEFEKGNRAFLNFGHTFGHAVELDESDLSHGEAVAIGILFALYLSEKTFACQLNMNAYLTYLKQLNFPIIIKPTRLEQYMRYLLHDKKNEKRQIRFVLLKEMQSPVLMSFNASEIEVMLNQFLNDMNEEVSECL